MRTADWKTSSAVDDVEFAWTDGRRFDAAVNERHCRLNGCQLLKPHHRPVYCAQVYVEMPRQAVNVTLYNLKIELACTALKTFFEPCAEVRRLIVLVTIDVINVEMKKNNVTLPYLTLPYLTLPYLTLPYLTLPYLTLPSGWASCYTCPALRPYQFSPMRNPDVTIRSQ